MYNFDFRDEVIMIRGNFTEGVLSNCTEEEVVDNIPVAVDGLPLAIINEDSGSNDGVMCTICQEPFSNEEPAKQLEEERISYRTVKLLMMVISKEESRLMLAAQ